ncbi:glycosyltransferase family 2 protein [bacterium]|nr:glycosyltransferase family 2 protein [bacterium]
MKTKLTVTISVYYKTKEEWLRKALDTILSQTFTNYEVVIVNDGADARVRDIVFSYKDRVSVDYGENLDAKIRYFETEKAFGSTAQARNVGLRHAQGEYIHFHDHDDFFIYRNGNQYVFENIFKEISDEDVFIFNFIHSNHKYSNCPKFSVIDMKNGLTEQNIADFANFSYFKTFSSWNKFFKTSFLKDNNLYFNEDLVVGEDIDHNFRFLFLTAKIKFTDEVYYFYRPVAGSVSSGANPYYCYSAQCAKYVVKTLKEHGVYEKLRIYFIKFFLKLLEAFTIKTVYEIEDGISAKRYVRQYVEEFNITKEDVKLLSDKEKELLFWII